MGNQQIENYKEEWRTCGGSSITEVSNLGRVRNAVTKRIRKLSTNAGGYLVCGLVLDTGDSKTVRVHRLVALAFLPADSVKREVNHIDGNKQNNRLDNLEWVTSKENKKHAWDNGLYSCSGENHGQAVYTEEQIRKVCEMLSVEPSNKLISEELGIAIHTIASIRSGRIWNNVSSEYSFDKKKVLVKDETLILKIADMLMDGHNTGYIADTLGVGRGEVNRVRRKDVHRQLLTEYNFPESKFSKLTEDIVHVVCQRLSYGEESVSEIARALGLTRDSISKIKNRKTHTEISSQYVW